MDLNPPFQGEVAPAGGRRGIPVSGEVPECGVRSASRNTPPTRKGAPPPLEGEDFRAGNPYAIALGHQFCCRAGGRSEPDRATPPLLPRAKSSPVLT
jgi:hypothetical protein